jgi:hypothetical protein
MWYTGISYPRIFPDFNCCTRECQQSCLLFPPKTTNSCYGSSFIILTCETFLWTKYIWRVLPFEMWCHVVWQKFILLWRNIHVLKELSEVAHLLLHHVLILRLKLNENIRKHTFRNKVLYLYTHTILFSVMECNNVMKQKKCYNRER